MLVGWTPLSNREICVFALIPSRASSFSWNSSLLILTKVEEFSLQTSTPLTSFQMKRLAFIVFRERPVNF